MRKPKERTTINFEQDVYERVLALRAKPEYARMSVSALVNMLLDSALCKEGKGNAYSGQSV